MSNKVESVNPGRCPADKSFCAKCQCAGMEYMLRLADKMDDMLGVEVCPMRVFIGQAVAGRPAFFDDAAPCMRLSCRAGDMDGLEPKRDVARMLQNDRKCFLSHSAAMRLLERCADAEVPEEGCCPYYAEHVISFLNK